MGHKLLLIEDVENLGRSGDIVSVKPGYSRNYLLPLGHAVVADARALKMQAKLQEERQQRAATDRKESDEMAGRLEGVTITKTVKVDHDGHMYGSVTVADIVQQLHAEHGLEVEKRFAFLKHPIKEVGVHTISFKLKEGVSANITLKVVPEEAHHSH